MKWINYVALVGSLCLSELVTPDVCGQARRQEAPTDGTASLEGIIQDAQTRKPIVGAVISAKSGAGTMRAQEVVTTDGSFRFILDPKQPYVITTKAEGYESVDERLAFTSSSTNRLYGKIIRLYRVGTKPPQHQNATIIETKAPPVAPAASATGMAKVMPPTDELAPADGLVSVDGVVIRAGTGFAVSIATVEIQSLQGKVLAQTTTAYQGRFFFRADPRYSYRIVAKADGYEPYEVPVVFPSVNPPKGWGDVIRLRPLALKTPNQPNATPTVSGSSVANAGARLTPPKTLDAKVIHTPALVVAPTGKTTQLRAIQFVQSKADLLPDAQPALEQLLVFMRDKPTVEIELAGHTDNQGDFDENVRLSKERVEVVKAYLVKNGIAANRITTRGYGPTRPVASNNNEPNRQQNRRVEMIVVKQ